LDTLVKDLPPGRRHVFTVSLMAARFKPGPPPAHRPAPVRIVGNRNMGSIGIPELLLILAILALLFGANRLPEMGRSLGKAIRGFKDASRKGDDHSRH
jgi:TatA/E family protein of Tat protein translocase